MITPTEMVLRTDLIVGNEYAGVLVEGDLMPIDGLATDFSNYVLVSVLAAVPTNDGDRAVQPVYAWLLASN